MYKKIQAQRTSLHVNNAYQGETIEQKVRRIMTTKEPIKDATQAIYTERKDGVLPAYNIRTDRFDIAIDAMDKVSKSHKATRERKMGDRAKEGMEKEKKTDQTKETGGQSTESK